jgi:hypothetical protein
MGVQNRQIFGVFYTPQSMRRENFTARCWTSCAPAALGQIPRNSIGMRPH